MKNKKLLSLVAMFAAAFLFLAACGGGDDVQTDEPADEPTEANEEPADEEESDATSDLQGEITFAWWGNEGRHVATQEIVDLFVAENPGVVVNTEYQPWGDYQEMFATDLMAGTEADLMQINFNWLALYSPNGDTFADLETLTDYLNLDNWDASDIDVVRTNGVVQAVPSGITARVPFMRSDIYESAGLDVQDINTWDDLMEAGRTIQEELGEDYFALSPLGKASMGYLVFSYLEQMTGRHFVDENNQFNYSLEELTEGFQLIQDFIDNGVMPPGQFDSDNIESINPNWIAGHYGGVSEWDSSINDWINNLEGGEDVIEVRDHFTMESAQLSGVMARPSMGFAISKQSQHQDIAAALLDFMLTDPRAIEILGTDRGVPSNNVGLETFNSLIEEGKIGGAAIDAHNIHANADATTLSPVFEFPEVREVYEDQLEAVHFGEKTVEEAAQFVYENIQGVIDSLVD